MPKEQANGALSFERIGPLAVPMGLRREGVSLGESDKAWDFFTHPYAVFHPHGGFYNLPTRPGVLAATLVERAEDGVILYDEVGTSSTERVSSCFPGALGGMRHRLFAADPIAAEPRYVRGFSALDLSLLRAFRLMTFLLKTNSPQRVYQELDGLLRNPNIRLFFEDCFQREDLAIISEGARMTDAALGERHRQAFAIRAADFCSSNQLTDARGRQIVVSLSNRWARFHEENSDVIGAIEDRRKEVEVRLKELKRTIDLEERKREAMKGIGRYISGRFFPLEPLREERDQLAAEQARIEEEYGRLPGYDKIKRYTVRIQAFEEGVKNVQRLATNMFDYCVTLTQIKELEDLVGKIAHKGSSEEREKDLSRYSLRLRTEIAPRLMTAISISSYVMRRPEALVGEVSEANVHRINTMAEKLLEYFRHVPYMSNSTLGDSFDDGWGQVRLLEARL